jgi:hypothetical protein
VRAARPASMTVVAAYVPREKHDTGRASDGVTARSSSRDQTLSQYPPGLQTHGSTECARERTADVCTHQQAALRTLRPDRSSQASDVTDLV